MRVITPPRALTLVIAIAAALATTLVPAAESRAQQPTTRKLGIVLLQFSDSKLDKVDEVRKTVKSLFFEAPDSAAKYYETQSRGARRSAPAAGDGVFGPFTIDHAAACDSGLLKKEASARIPADVKADDIAIVFPNGKAGCGWAGLGQMPGNTTWFPAEWLSQAAVLHEVGHNLGFDHQLRDVCAEGKLTNCKEEGCSVRTPMGCGGNELGLSAPELVHTGWLPADRRVSPTTSGSVRLVPLHAPYGTAGVRAIDVPLGNDDRLVVEYRTPDKATVDRSVFQGVNIYRVSGKKYSDARIVDGTPPADDGGLNSLPVGKTLGDLAAKVSVTVDSETADGAEVRISFGDAAPPTASSNAQPANAAPPTTVTAPPSTPAAAAKVADKLHDVKDAVPFEAPKVEQATLAATGASTPVGLLIVLAVCLVLAGTVLTGLTLRRRRSRS